MRAQAGVETEKEREREKESLQGRGKLGKTDFVEEGRSLKQPSVLDSSKENRLIQRLSSNAGAHSCMSTEFQLPSKPAVDILKLTILEKVA